MLISPAFPSSIFLCYSFFSASCSCVDNFDERVSRIWQPKFNWQPVREFRLFTTDSGPDFMVAIPCTRLPTFGRLGGDAQDAANFWAFPRLIESNENGFVGGGNKSTFNWRVIFWHLYFGNGHQSES